jgi:hypothetical protein
MNLIYEYIHDKKNNRVGVVCAVPCSYEPQVVRLGWSRCNVSMGDKFSKELGLMIAINRAVKGTWNRVPDSVQDKYNKVGVRAKKYFKDKKVIASYL